MLFRRKDIRTITCNGREKCRQKQAAGRRRVQWGGVLLLLVSRRIGVQEVLSPALADEKNHIREEDQEDNPDQEYVRAEKIYDFGGKDIHIDF